MIRNNACDANCKTIIANAILKFIIPIDKFRWSNRLKYGSHIFAKNRPNDDWYPPGNQDNSA